MFAYTDHVVQLPTDAPLEPPGEQPAIYVEGRGERPLMSQWSGVPTRRLQDGSSSNPLDDAHRGEGKWSKCVPK